MIAEWKLNRLFIFPQTILGPIFRDKKKKKKKNHDLPILHKTKLKLKSVFMVLKIGSGSIYLNIHV